MLLLIFVALIFLTEILHISEVRCSIYLSLSLSVIHDRLARCGTVIIFLLFPKKITFQKHSSLENINRKE